MAKTTIPLPILTVRVLNNGRIKITPEKGQQIPQKITPQMLRWA
jgi:hypothetical protein